MPYTPTSLLTNVISSFQLLSTINILHSNFTMSSPPNTLVLNHLLFLTTPITCHCCYHFDPCITHFIMSAIFISFPILFYYKLPYFALSFFSQFTLLPLYCHYNPPCPNCYYCMSYYYILQTHFLVNPCPSLSYQSFATTNNLLSNCTLSFSPNTL